ncbi:hypothetical protein [Nonomuraea sp. NPDC001699]
MRFADGSAITTDLLIGADGTWSRIRPLVSDAWPAYTGISFVETDLFDAESRHRRSTAVIGGGFFIALGDERGVLAHRESDGSLHVYTGGDSDEATLPAPWQLIALVLATVLVVAALTSVPAHLGGRRPVAATL